MSRSKARGRALRGALGVSVAVALALAAPAGAGASGPPRPRPPLEVVVSAYPLAQMVSYIGGGYVHVVDLARPGQQPQGLSLGPAGRRLVAAAPLVVYVGDGYQPQVERAARSARRHLALLPAVSRRPRPYPFWLDPYLVAPAADRVAAALAAAYPAGRRQFHNGALDLQSVASSLSSDLESTFSNCTRRQFVTADDAFGRMAAAFGLVDVAVDGEGAAKAVALVRRESIPAVFAERGVADGLLRQVARRTGAKVEYLDPLETAPRPGTGALSYFAVMEEDLTNLEGPLACDTSSSFS